ncbi:MAG: tyrosine recombinase XerD [Candidatus Fermentibacteraceae bacterium]|nr:tyrosine recombinase XerD [Candidatus Fermentibacteraceae bacterium]MBN2608733.1 tyrosine recombinase XerD [Candidatus Fermentibacteraceae bacterium]
MAETLIGSPSLDSFLEYSALEKKLALSTVEAYQRDLVHYLRWLSEACRDTAGTSERMADVSNASYADLADYVSFLSSEGYSSTSIRRKLSTVRGYYRYLQISGLREDNPAEMMPSPRKPDRLPHAVSVDTVKAMIEVWNGDSPLSLRNRALMELAYGAGLRESEITGMTVARVHLDQSMVRPLGKGSKERLVPIGGAAVRWISRYLDEARPLLACGPSTPMLFLTYRGNRLSRMTVWNIVRTSARRAGVKDKVHPHTLRHSFATHLLQGGADLRVVQELLGHSDIRTTEIYTSVDRSWLRSVMDRYHPRSRET